MSVLHDSPHAPEHPFSIYVSNLRNGTSVSWFSRSGTVEQIRDYLWGVMRLRYENTRHSDEGFAMTSAGTVLFIGVAGTGGSVLTCFPMDDIGVQRINDAISDEDEQMRADLNQGTWTGNGPNTHKAMVSQGEDPGESGIFDLMNGASIVPLAR